MRRGRPQAVDVPHRHRSFLVCLGAALALAGCGGESTETGGEGGAGGAGLERRSTFELSCSIDTITLEIPITLDYALDAPLTESEASSITLRATVTLAEDVAAALIDAGVPTIDLLEVRVRGSVTGASPASIEATLAGVPINDFDLRSDPDDDGAPGPHELDLDEAMVDLRPDTGVAEVVLGLDLDGLAWTLGDFSVPDDCTQPTLVGFAASYPVSSSD